MNVNSRNNVNFGSHFVLTEALSPQKGAELAEYFKTIAMDSPYLSEAKHLPIKSVTSIIDENDWRIERYLGQIGAVIKEKIPTLKYLTELHHGNEARAKALINKYREAARLERLA